MLNELRSRGHVTAIAVATTAAALPFVAAGVVALTVVWYPVSDWGLIEMQTADVYSAQPPMVGAYSRLGLNHPGPMLFWLLAPVYQLAGKAPAGLLAGAALVGAVSAAGTVRAAARLGGRALALGSAALVAALGAWGLTGTGMVDPWNPTLPLLPFVWFGVLAWEVAAGRWRSLPWLVGTGSLAAQSHLAYAAPTVAIAATAVGLGLTGRVGPVGGGVGPVGGGVGPVGGDDPTDRSPQGARWGARWGHSARPGARVLAAACATAVVLWLAPLWQQATAADGNLGRVAAHLAGGDDNGETLGGDVALGLLGRVALLGDTGHLSQLQDGRGALTPWSPSTGALVLVALAVAAAAMWRWHRRAIAAGCALVLVGALAMAAGTAGMVGDAFPWLLRPMVALPVWGTILAAWAATEAPAVQRLRRDTPHPRRERWGWIGAATVALVSLAGAPRALAVAPPHEAWSTAAEGLCEPASAALRARGVATLVITPETGLDLGFLSFGCMATFARTGIDVRVPKGVDDVLVPNHGPRAGAGTAPAVAVVTGPVAIARAQARPGTVTLSTLTPTAAQRAAGVPDAAVVETGLGFA